MLSSGATYGRPQPGTFPAKMSCCDVIRNWRLTWRHFLRRRKRPRSRMHRCHLRPSLDVALTDQRPRRGARRVTTAKAGLTRRITATMDRNDDHGPTASPSGPGSSLEQVLADYLRAVEAGQGPDREDILARHPSLAQELREFFANHDRVARLVEPLAEPV